VAKLQWHKLDRDRMLSMIESVKSANDHIMFSIATSEAKCAKLAFYKNLLIYRLTNYSSLPSFAFDYLGDGKNFRFLDGGPSAIYAANDAGYLALNEMTVLDYASFFFDHVSGPDGDIAIIDNPKDHPVLDALGPNQRVDIEAHHEPAEIAPDGQGGFIIRASLFYLGILVRGTVTVDAAGRVDVTETKMLLSTTKPLSAEGAHA